MVGSDGGRHQKVCGLSGPSCLDLSSKESLGQELASKVALSLHAA